MKNPAKSPGLPSLFSLPHNLTLDWSTSGATAVRIEDVYSGHAGGRKTIGSSFIGTANLVGEGGHEVKVTVSADRMSSFEMRADGRVVLSLRNEASRQSRRVACQEYTLPTKDGSCRSGYTKVNITAQVTRYKYVFTGGSIRLGGSVIGNRYWDRGEGANPRYVYQRRQTKSYVVSLPSQSTDYVSASAALDALFATFRSLLISAAQSSGYFNDSLATSGYLPDFRGRVGSVTTLTRNQVTGAKCTPTQGCMETRQVDVYGNYSGAVALSVARSPEDQAQDRANQAPLPSSARVQNRASASPRAKYRVTTPAGFEVRNGLRVPILRYVSVVELTSQQVQNYIYRGYTVKQVSADTLSHSAITTPESLLERAEYQDVLSVPTPRESSRRQGWSQFAGQLSPRVSRPSPRVRANNRRVIR